MDIAELNVQHRLQKNMHYRKRNLEKRLLRDYLNPFQDPPLDFQKNYRYFINIQF